MSSRKDVECSGCGTLIGVEHTYKWGPHGQDPPEIVFDHEDEVVFDDYGNIFCSQECHDGFHGLYTESEEEQEEDAQGSLFETIKESERIQESSQNKL